METIDGIPESGKQQAATAPSAADVSGGGGAMVPQEEGAGAQAGVNGRRILLVDDNADVGNSMATLLQVMGHEVRYERDPGKGVEVLLEWPPKVAFIDIAMPGMNGYQLAAALREARRDYRAMLVAMTGYGRDEDRERALASGFDHHLLKPPAPEAIEALLAQSDALAS